MKTMQKYFFQEIQSYSVEDIEKSVVKYAIESIQPQYRAKDLDIFSQNANQNIIHILKSNNIPVCFETFNFLFESMLDKISKNKHGIVFTPKYIVDFICKNTLSKFDNRDQITIIDPSCGCGIFLISAIEFLKNHTKQSIKEILNNQIFGLDIHQENINRVKLLLKIMGLQYGEIIDDEDLHIQCRDSLKESWDKVFLTNFDCIIGNPPYVNPHSLSKEQTRFLKQNFITTSSGVFNIFYAFIEQSIKFIKDSGKISFIVPNNFLTISAAKPLRDFLESYLYELIDCKDNMIFRPIRTYNAIITLSKQQTKTIHYAGIQKTNNIPLALESLSFQDLHKKNVFLSKWRFLDSKTEANIQKIEHQFINTKPFINAGIATLKDEVYRVDFDGKNYYKKYNQQQYIIDNKLIKPLYKIPELKDSVKNGFVIFPYIIKNAMAHIIHEKTMQTTFSLTYNYLQARKNDLDTRDKGKINPVAWYAYGRTQGLNRYGRKLLFSTFAKEPHFVLIENKEALFCNGYAVFENGVIELEVLEKILNSFVLQYYIEHTSYQIEGGYYCYQKKYIEKFSIPFLDLEEKNFLLHASKQEIDSFLIKKYELKL